jgi:hypothetical protein
VRRVQPADVWRTGEQTTCDRRSHCHAGWLDLVRALARHQASVETTIDSLTEPDG